MRPADSRQMRLGAEELPAGISGVADEAARALGFCADERARSGARERLRKTLDLVPQMLWHHDVLTGECYYSAQWRDFTGVLIGTRGLGRLQLVHPDDRERAGESWASTLATGAPYEAEYRLRHRSGEYRWILSRGRPERDGSGAIVAWHGSATDIHDLVLAREALNAREKKFRQILDSIPHIIWSADAEGRMDYLSQQWVSLHGAGIEAASSDEWLGVLHPEDRARAAERWRHSIETGTDYECRLRVRKADGDYVWTLARGLPVHNEAGGIVRWYGTLTDIHEQVLGEQALIASEALNRGIIHASPDSVSLLDLEGTRLFVNEATVICYGVDSARDLIGRRWGESFPPDIEPQADVALAKAQRGEIGRLTCQKGRRWWDVVLAPVRDESGRPIRIVVISRDVTEQRQAQEKAQWAASHDNLTGLPNRFLFQHRLEEAIACAEADGESFALLLFDVDDFKRVNDTVGHDAGDALLCAFAHRLAAAVREEDTVARLGGDEFAVLLRGCSSEAGVLAAYESLREKLREPCIHGGRVMDCGASIGTSFYPRDGSDRTEILKSADLALYAAKAAGGANLQFFRPAMRTTMQKRASMLSLARDALRQNRIVPHYQPKVDIRSGAVAGYEALLRWRHPRRGIQLPATVAAAFEDIKLAGEISDHMIKSVIADMRHWLDAGVDFGHVAVNASAAEFRRGDFAERLLARLDAVGIPPSRFQLEVTETVFLGRGAEYVERALKTLDVAGVKVALDDFGTGYASLSHLKQFPVHILKIDRSFVADLEKGGGGAAIVGAVTGLGKSLGIKIVAEGVETLLQQRLLADLGCDYGQGFLYGKASPADLICAAATGRTAARR